MIECRCRVINMLSGQAADDYVRQHLDQRRQDPQGRKFLRCPDSDVTFVLEAEEGVYGGDAQVRLRRGDR